MHRVINYGSVLQAYATQYIVEKLGCNAIIIDYLFPNKEHLSPIKRVRSFWGNLYHKFFHTSEYRKKKAITKFCQNNLHLSKEYSNSDILKNDSPWYDIYMVGSDQVWNPIHMKGDDTFLLGFTPLHAYKISFSSSFATNNLPDKIKNDYIRNLNNFEYLSVRERNGAKLIKDIIGKDVPITLDPTLMLNTDDWETLIAHSSNKFEAQKYILLYIQNYAFNPAPYIFDLLLDLQKKTGLNIYSLSRIPKSYMNKKIKCIIDASPITFLQAFKCASYIVTSSFHGTAFALNFGIPLFSIVSNKLTEDDRQTSLLKSVGLEKCIIIKGSQFKSHTEVIYNKEDIYCKLASLRKESMEYLKKAVNI